MYDRYENMIEQAERESKLNARALCESCASIQCRGDLLREYGYETLTGWRCARYQEWEV